MFKWLRVVRMGAAGAKRHTNRVDQMAERLVALRAAWRAPSTAVRTAVQTAAPMVASKAGQKAATMERLMAAQTAGL